MPLFSTPTVKTVKWEVSNSTSVEVTVDRKVISRIANGSIEVSGFGDHRIIVNANWSRRGRLRILVDGIAKVDYVNVEERDVDIEVSCVGEKYDIGESARGINCRSGFRKVSRTEYRRENDVTSGVRNRARRTSFTAWSTSVPSAPKSTTGHWGTYVHGSILHDRTIYSCVAESNCKKPGTEKKLFHVPAISKSVDVNNIRTVAEKTAYDLNLQRLKDEAAERARIKAEEKERKRLEAIQAIADAAERARATQQIETERKERADAVKYENLLNEIRRSTEGSVAEITTSQDTKYRIISPLIYENVRGQTVPQVRYESVRLLSPETVSSYVARGYEIEMVDQDTPLSYSKPYGKSLIQRVSGLRQTTAAQGTIIPRDVGRRKTIQELSAEAMGKTRNKYKTIVKREYTSRRTVE